jgi:hypothetical protein
MFLYQMKGIAIVEVSKFWFEHSPLKHNYNKNSKFDFEFLNVAIFTQVAFETIEQLVLQCTNNVLTNTWSPLGIISIVLVHNCILFHEKNNDFTNNKRGISLEEILNSFKKINQNNDGIVKNDSNQNYSTIPIKDNPLKNKKRSVKGGNPMDDLKTFEMKSFDYDDEVFEMKIVNYDDGDEEKSV